MTAVIYLYNVMWVKYEANEKNSKISLHSDHFIDGDIDLSVGTYGDANSFYH